jgi:hypothetical protein
MHFPVVSQMARDFLAIPATSVSVERLFSRSHLSRGALIDEGGNDNPGNADEYVD